MNGGRLSNDETFLLGVGELRSLLAAPQPDADAAERAITRIGLRYPEEADELRSQWRSPGTTADMLATLNQIETQHRADSDED